ncbi:MAG TPA: hypothetical protein VF510_26780 [Ktedonobacterales bacterium]
MPHQVSSGDLRISWSPIHNPAWDDTPEAYVEHGLVAWGRSRRLARCEDPRRHVKAYIGIQHDDPTRWHLAGESRTRYFLSLFLAGRTLSLRTYPTIAAALAALDSFHSSLAGSTSP